MNIEYKKKREDFAQRKMSVGIVENYKKGAKKLLKMYKKSIKDSKKPRKTSDFRVLWRKKRKKLV